MEILDEKRYSRAGVQVGNSSRHNRSVAFHSFSQGTLLPLDKIQNCCKQSDLAVSSVVLPFMLCCYTSHLFIRKKI